jgi:uncharacterized membrane protein
MKDPTGSAATSLHRQCRKCGHVRLPTDAGPDWACPACGGAYAKTYAAAAAREEQARDAARNPAWGEPTPGGVEPPPPPPPPALAQERRRQARVQLAYLLLALPTGITAVVAALIARGIAAEAPQSWLEGHSRWQLRTFWTALVVGGVIALLALLLAGGAALSARMGDGAGASGSSPARWLWLPTAALWLWMLWRAAIGWMLLQRGDEP